MVNLPIVCSCVYRRCSVWSVMVGILSLGVVQILVGVGAASLGLVSVNAFGVEQIANAEKTTDAERSLGAAKIVTDTDWLKPKKGAKGQKMGAKVESVTETEESGVYRVEVSIPKGDKEIEEVVAIGRREKVEKPVLQKRRFEIINDPDTGRSGVVIYMGKPESFALKFNYYEGETAY